MFILLCDGVRNFVVSRSYDSPWSGDFYSCVLKVLEVCISFIWCSLFSDLLPCCGFLVPTEMSKCREKIKKISLIQNTRRMAMFPLHPLAIYSNYAALLSTILVGLMETKLRL